MAKTVYQLISEKTIEVLIVAILAIGGWTLCNVVDLKADVRELKTLVTLHIEGHKKNITDSDGLAQNNKTCSANMAGQVDLKIESIKGGN